MPEDPIDPLGFKIVIVFLHFRYHDFERCGPQLDLGRVGVLQRHHDLFRGVH